MNKKIKFLALPLFIASCMQNETALDIARYNQDIDKTFTADSLQKVALEYENDKNYKSAVAYYLLSEQYYKADTRFDNSAKIAAVRQAALKYIPQLMSEEQAANHYKNVYFYHQILQDSEQHQDLARKIAQSFEKEQEWALAYEYYKLAGEKNTEEIQKNAALAIFNDKKEKSAALLDENLLYPYIRNDSLFVINGKSLYSLLANNDFAFVEKLKSSSFQSWPPSKNPLDSITKKIKIAKEVCSTLSIKNQCLKEVNQEVSKVSADYNYSQAKEICSLIDNAKTKSTCFANNAQKSAQKCERNLDECINAGDYYYEVKNDKLALHYYDIAYERNKKFNQNYVEILGNHCSAKNTATCFTYGYIKSHFDNFIDYKVAMSAYQKACAKNDYASCNNLGVLYKDKKAVKLIDTKKSFAFFQKACHGGDEVGCSNLGGMYEKGQAVTQNFETAKKYYRISCDKGYKKACGYYNNLEENVVNIDSSEGVKQILN